MGLFSFLKGKEPTVSLSEITFPVTLGAVAKGNFVSMAEIPDEVFSSGAMGSCCGINPCEGNICTC